MPGIPDYVLVHTAFPLTYEPSVGVWVEGEPGDGGGDPTLGVPFACVLFLPGPGGDEPNPYRPRTVRAPQLLCNARRQDDSPIALDRESELLITAVELAPWTGAETRRWQMVGDAQPFGPPGQVLGLLATLRRVED